MLGDILRGASHVRLFTPLSFEPYLKQGAAPCHLLIRMIKSLGSVTPGEDYTRSGRV